MAGADKVIHLHTKIKYRWGTDENGKQARRSIETTPGRIMLGNALPKHLKIPLGGADVVGADVAGADVAGADVAARAPVSVVAEIDDPVT